MISPSIGRVVWFTPSKSENVQSDQKMAALVAYVHSDRCVNLAVFDCNGVAVSRCSVLLLQDDDVAPEHGYYAEWMPYQKGQAAKHESSSSTDTDSSTAPTANSADTSATDTIHATADVSASPSTASASTGGIEGNATVSPAASPVVDVRSSISMRIAAIKGHLQGFEESSRQKIHFDLDTIERLLRHL